MCSEAAVARHHRRKGQTFEGCSPSGLQGRGGETGAVSACEQSHRSRRHFQDPSPGRSGLRSVPEDIPPHARARRADPEFISIKAYTGEDGEEIDLVRFANEDALKIWKEQPEHREAQRRGREEFYDRYSVQACKVIRDYEFRMDELG